MQQAIKPLTKPTLSGIVQDIYKANLSDSELAELTLIINALKSLDPESSDEKSNSPNSTTVSEVKSKAAGCIEAKMINNCGPYLYLRYYKGCKNGRSQYGSKYLGKA